MTDAARAGEWTVRLWRGGSTGSYRRYGVPRAPNQTVLDVVTFVQRHIDASLAYRYACRVGVCGSCAMTVNGRPRWTCRTLMSQVAKGDTVEVGPLRNLPVIKDLAADMAVFFDKWDRAKGRFAPTDPDLTGFAVIPPGSAARRAANDGIECIGCGVCYAACDVVAWNPDYLGPAALNRAWTLVNDVRDGGQGVRLRAAAAAAGCHNCHTHQSCTSHCPKELDPSGAIAGLKRAVFVAALRGDL